MARNTRSIQWINFPPGACDAPLDALTVVAEGAYPSVAKPLTGLGSDVMELALLYRGVAFRVVYTLQIGADIWVIHCFQKESKSGIATPKQEIDLVRDRIRRLREALHGR